MFTNKILDIIDPRIEAIFYIVLVCLKRKKKEYVHLTLNNTN